MPDFEKSSAVLPDIEAGNKVTDHEPREVVSRHSTPPLASRSRRNHKNKDNISDRISLQRTDDSDKSSTISTTVSSPDSTRKIISFHHDDHDDPHNWHWAKKSYVVFVSILGVMNSTIASGLASNSAPYYAAEFHVTSNYLLVLATSMFLVGYVFGPVFFGPMSEQYGRRTVMIWGSAWYSIFTMACALAPNFAALVIFRFLTGLGAACPITVVGGTCADVYKNHEARGRAMAIFMAATTFGPCIGPVISAYISTINWRWSFWVALILAGITFIILLFVPETYGPLILVHRAARLRKSTGDQNIYAPMELEQRDFRHIATVVLARPIRMFFFEAIVLFSCIYLSFAYGIFYMFFQSYPIIYEETYGFTDGQEGLTFLAIGVGACLSCLAYLGWDLVLRRARAQDKTWVKKEEMRRLPLACLAGPFFILSCFWVGWTARRDIHWIVPVLAGIPYGIGYLLVFMALLNYLVDAYKIFAASALGAASAVRSVFGAILPFAARPMYKTLGVAWACSLLGFLSCLMAIIPFIFIWKGEELRANSKFCQYLLEKESEESEKMEVKKADRERRGTEVAEEKVKGEV
ncbi:MFS general substrate transporter [Venturia nashicola]|nr:MFS general substrate transporter [Venturia nashicola]